nr:hypothetical protein [uncultured Lichenicoccus sp.]
MLDLAALPNLKAVAACVMLVAVLSVLLLQRRRVQRTVRVGMARMRYAEGVRAGQLDRNREWKPGQPLYEECPYKDGSDDHFIWQEGYLDASHMIMPSLPISGLIT